jgi:hypothetical protein
MKVKTHIRAGGVLEGPEPIGANLLVAKRLSSLYAA